MQSSAQFVRFALLGALASTEALAANPKAAPTKTSKTAAAKVPAKSSQRAPKSAKSMSGKPGKGSTARRAPAKKPWRPKPSMVAMDPSSRAASFAALDESACLRALDERGIAYRREPSAPGVKIPIRLSGPVAGVLYRTDYPDKERQSVPWEVLDCRLALALYDWSEILRSHGIHEVRMFSVWRPPAASWPSDKIAKRHPGGLAIDVREFRRESEPPLIVDRDWNGRIGAPVCGDRASPPSPATEAAKELRTIICRTANERIFHSMLTPNHDRMHKNHFHLELAAGVSWFMLE